MKKITIFLTALVLLLCLSPAVSAAGEVTDTLTVKVGYWGMDTDSYVTVGTYHWSELEANLPLHQVAYSFYRSGVDGSYYTVIDSAYGFYISDLISYAGIYAGDVQSMQFYTKDQSVGYFTSFTYGELFGTTRYYFEDLAAHIHPTFDEEGNFIAWDASEAWDYCTAVQPMLALEDSWAQFEIGTEHTAPDFSSLGTGNRFRLLFGQSNPLEVRTNQTAKYTHTVYVTLSGSPTLGELPALDTTLGSHSVTTTVTVSSGAIIDALSSILSVTSTDDSVLRITGIVVSPDPDYSDLATVEITYEILKEGEAGISAAIGGQPFAEIPPVAVTVPPQASEPEPTEADVPSTEPMGGSETPEATSGPATPSEEPISEQDASTAEEPDKEDTASPKGGSAILLDASLAAQLAERAEQDASPAEPVTALTIPEEEPSNSALFTALGAGLCILLGAAASLLHYKKE